jgi:deazaflavin-dependent oxidoreductase (nitroreductase family)
VTGTGDREAVRAALARGGTIDITTLGRRSGRPRRIEIVFFAIDGRVWISGLPGRRGWIANLSADPRLTFHLKGRVNADLPASARIVTDDAERRPVLEHVTSSWGRRAQLPAFLDRAPLIEVTFDDPSLGAA